MYPFVWYNGPLYASAVEDPDRARASERHPINDYIDILLQRFAERGHTLYGSLNLHWLPSLQRDMNSDITEIIAGSDTYNLVLNNNTVQTSTFHTRPPLFDVLRSEVQQALLNVIDEMLSRYGQEPAFKGLVFHLTEPSELWLGGLEGGYSDWDIAQFEADTAITVQVAGAPNPTRFSERYDWLQTNYPTEWMNWRCGRIRDFYQIVSQHMLTTRSDLNLVLIYIAHPMHIIL